MIDNKSVLNNPLIPRGYYYVQVLRIEAEPVAGFTFSREERNIDPVGGQDDD